MNEDILKGNWNILKGRIKERYGEITDDDLTKTEGNLDQVAGLVQKCVGKTRDEVKEDLRELANSV